MSFETNADPFEFDQPSLYEILIGRLNDNELQVYTTVVEELADDPEKYFALVVDDEEYENHLSIVNEALAYHWIKQTSNHPAFPYQPLTKLEEKDLLLHPLTRWGVNPEDALLNALNAWESYQTTTPPPRHSGPE